MKSRREFLRNSTMGAFIIGSHNPFTTQKLPAFNEDKFKYFKACSTGDIVVLKSLLIDNPNLLYSHDDLGRSGFTISMLNGHHAISSFLKGEGYKRDIHESVLDRDWDQFDRLVGEESIITAQTINHDHPMGGSAMWAAASGGAGADMWRIYAKCGDPNYVQPRLAAATSPLQAAIRYQDLAVAELTAATLLSNYADPNLTGDGDDSPLHIAAERGSYELTEMLIRLGANVNLLNKDQKSTKQLAEQNGHQKVHELLENHIMISRTCRTSRSAFDAFGKPYQADDVNDIPLFLRRRFVGQSHGNIDYIKKEVATDSRYVHSIATTSEKCIEACAHTGRKNVVEFLLNHGSPYSLPTAVLMNDFTTVTKYLDQDPNRIHERGAHDFALLWYPVIGKCDLDMTQLLLDRGAKVEEQHFLGTTALHWACMRGPIELVELLVENGANINRIGRKFGGKSKTPLQSTEDKQIADYLKSKGAKV